MTTQPGRKSPAALSSGSFCSSLSRCGPCRFGNPRSMQGPEPSGAMIDPGDANPRLVFLEFVSPPVFSRQILCLVGSC